MEHLFNPGRSTKNSILEEKESLRVGEMAMDNESWDVAAEIFTYVLKKIFRNLAIM